MNLRKYSMDIENVLIDEELLRLLYYKPINYSDSPLDQTKDNILDKENKWDIINDVLVSAPKFDDLETTPKCRLLFYPANGRNVSNNFLFTHQEFAFEIYTHFEFENVDKRNEWICDRVNELLFNKRITGIGKILHKNRQPVKAPKGYLGYRLVYEFVSENY